MNRHCLASLILLSRCVMPTDLHAAAGRFAEFDRITPASRETIDHRVMAEEIDVPARNNEAFYAGFSGWIASRMQVPREYLQRRAVDAHAQIVAGQPMIAIPTAAQDVLERLTTAIPPHLAPPTGAFRLTIIDGDDQPLTQTAGYNFLYIRHDYLTALLADPQSGSARLAFALANEMGHVCRGQTDERYRLLWLRENLDSPDSINADRHGLSELLARLVRTNGDRIQFITSLDDELQADMFAAHLCRNAGFDVNVGLDIVRVGLLRLNGDPTNLPIEDAPDGAAANAPDAADGDDAPAVPDNDPNAATRSALQLRLLLLRHELDGTIVGDQYGLFQWDHDSQELAPVADGGLAAADRAIVMIHGMESSLETFRGMFDFLSHDQRFPNTRLLGLQYPSDASLAQVAGFLVNEINRTGLDTANTDFVGHSAGGLVFRYYAEVAGGPFRQAMMIGTPQAGSDLSKLRPLLEAKQFFGDLDLGYSEAMQRAISDGRGQISWDLQTDSLFLRYLNRADRLRHTERYHIIRGRAFRTGQALLIRASIAAGRLALQRRLEQRAASRASTAATAALLDLVHMPNEMANGDLAVTLDSAALEGVTDVATFDRNHTQLPRDPNVMQATADALLIDSN